MENCIFCKIINKQIPSRFVYEDEDVIAILDISQVTLGHTLVIPKKHISDFATCDDETQTKLSKVAKKIFFAIFESLPKYQILAKLLLTLGLFGVLQRAPVEP